MSKLFIESDGTANGTYVFMGDERLQGVRRIEILINEDGNSSVAIETEEVEEQRAVLTTRKKVDTTPSLEGQLKAFVNSQPPVVSQEEAREMLLKLLAPEVVNAAEGILVVDLRN